MNEEIDEYDVYHQDFTTASEWEVFIARIEEVLNEWRLSNSKRSKRCVQYTKKWIGKSEEINYQGMNFTLSYHTLELAPISEDLVIENAEKQKDSLYNGLWESTKQFMSDFDGSPFPVSHWFGLQEYVMLCPHSPLVDESNIKLVMSSVNIAFGNVDCSVPIFVKVREHWQQCFLGIYEDAENKTSFDTIHLKRIPSQCSHLNGLANLFKGKISSTTALEPIQISAKFSYELKDLEPFVWRRPPPTNEFLSIDGFDVKKLTSLPFGAEKNPIKSALLNVIWPRFLENAVIDSGNYSDFDPVMAPTWTITIKMRENLNYYLSELVNKLMGLLENNYLLMDTLGLSKSLGLVNPLNKITEAPITISKLVKAAMGSNSSSEFKGPISDDLLMALLYYIFPDAIDDKTHRYPEQLDLETKQNDSSDPKLCSYVKASPENGLVWRLSTAAARLYDAGGLPYLAHLWYEFTQELQYRWEHKIPIPGVLEGIPNARTCLLHQKLQLLNCCISRAGADSQGSGAGNSDDDDQDEFYDCSENEDADDDQLPWDKPTGRLERLEGATLKNGAPLYIPRTQDPAPKTEDQLEEDAELMVRLGDDARASELRARMMSASLLSDMEAFKAANPGAELCDFVCWYSPRDWKPDDGGALGDRMLLPGNPWAETWDVARPVPAARQRRLFDESREAERVLHFLVSRSAAAVAELVLPAVLRAGARRALEEGGGGGGGGAPGCDRRRTLELAARDLYEAERDACSSVCRRRVLGSAAEGCALPAEGRARLLSAAGGALPPAALREFSLRVRHGSAPQLLRAVLSQDMLLVGAFTEPLVVM